MDVAASEFFRSGKYDLDFKSPDDPSRYITPDELANLYKSFIRDYPGECSRSGCRCASGWSLHWGARCSRAGSRPAVVQCDRLQSLSQQPPEQTWSWLH